LQSRLVDVLAAAKNHTYVVNGRFKGGYITRHYGQPAERIDVVQLELAQCNYMDEDSFEYRADLAPRVEHLLRALLGACLV
jgi:N-formylglutamate deformylase